MKRLGVIGLGLMGGSLGMAVKNSDAEIEVRGYARRPETRSLALEMGAADFVSDDPASIVAESDMVVFCLPVLRIPELLSQCVNAMKAGTVVTDVGSTKAKIQQDVLAVMADSDAEFVGSHPICGSEKRGLENASADLYNGAVAIVTPIETTPEPVYSSVAGLWRRVGCKVIRMEAATHDRCLARTSHLPHMAAAILSAVVGRDDHTDDLAACCGTGFRDATRLAEGAPDIWKDIVQTNSKCLVEELTALRDGTGELLDLLEQEDFEGVERFLAAGREMRRRLTGANEKDRDE